MFRRFKSARAVFGILAVLLFFVALAALAVDYYKLTDVKRVDQDLYRSGDLYVQTRYCYHYTYGEDAVLKWEGEYGNNKIIWHDDSTCEVKTIFKK